MTTNNSQTIRMGAEDTATASNSYTVHPSYKNRRLNFRTRWVLFLTRLGIGVRRFENVEAFWHSLKETWDTPEEDEAWKDLGR